MTRTAIIVSAAILLLLPIMALGLLSLFSRRPDDLGVTDNRLRDCPDSPNCVCSQAKDHSHKIDPFPLSEPPAAAMNRLKRAIATFPRTAVVEETDTYLRAEFTSALFRFVDDIEFLIDEPAGLIHVRSASRAGHSDLGVNRQRVEAIRARLLKED